MNSTPLSSAPWGAWSVAIASTTPSASAPTSDCRSLSERSGGLILACVSYGSPAGWAPVGGGGTPPPPPSVGGEGGGGASAGGPPPPPRAPPVGRAPPAPPPRA